MKLNNIFLILVLTILSACGGAGGESTTVAPTVPDNGVITYTKHLPPAPNTNQTQTTVTPGTNTINIATSFGNFEINQIGLSPSVNISYSSNTVDIVMNQNITSLDITGNNNTVILRAKTSITTTLSVGGTGNVVWIPRSMTLPNISKAADNGIFSYQD